MAYIASNYEKIATYKAAYAVDHREEIAAYMVIYTRARRKTDPQFKLAKNLRNRLNMAIKNGQKAGSAVRDLGCTIAELKVYLEKLFQPGMSWENWGRGHGKWNIDHIKPLVSFDLTNREQFLDANHYTNLQPLWFEDNMKKGARTT